MVSLENLCRICSDDLKEDGVGIFSAECMEKLVGEKIKRYLYFSVSIKDDLPKKVCDSCLTKLDNIHLFAKMAAEMQEKFRMLLAQEEARNCKPKIKLRRLDELKPETTDTVETGAPNDENTENVPQVEGVDMEYEVVVEEVACPDVNADAGPENEDENDHPEEVNIKKENDFHIEEDIEEDDEKPSPSLLHSLLLKGKSKGPLTGDHDYPVKKEPMVIKEEPEDPEDEDIAEEIEEDRLNQIIKEEMESDEEEEEGEEEEEMSNDSDVEITEMEVKVDPMLYFSNTSQTAIELDADSQDTQDSGKKTLAPSGKKSDTSPTGSKNNNSKKPSSSSMDDAIKNGLVMTRSQQKVNPVIMGLKLGKPYKCTLCPRSFITDIGLQNHLWSHLPKSKKNGGPSVQGMVHKNVDLEDSQVYSSNGVLHTAMPSENPHLLKYVCPICGKKISTKGNLKVHLETHRPKGKYGCDICGRVFKTAANLYRHKDYHGGVQFPCNVCGRVYPTNSTLRAHSITHSDLRPHKCPLCSKTFKRNQDLKFHINQHTGARPYQCPYCPKAFASSGNCFSHRKRMHPVEVERDKERAAEIIG